MSHPITLYTDFISPFAWLAMAHLERQKDRPEIAYKPVLFAGMLNHWEHKGPAEIPAKKTFTFTHVKWIAERDGIELNLPPHHPFNPLRALRLAIALGAGHDVMMKIFQSIWVDGHLPDNDDGWNKIKQAVDCADGDDLIADATVKSTLISNGEEALSKGVFGVPTFCVDQELFWGVDAMEMMQDYLAAPEVFRQKHDAATRLTPSSTRI